MMRVAVSSLRLTNTLVSTVLRAAEFEIHKFRRPRSGGVGTDGAHLDRRDAITDFEGWRGIMDKRIEAAQGIIEREYDKPLRIRDVAKRSGLSRSHLEFLFKGETGLTVKAYHREVRLQWAVELLREEHVSVKEAALSVGYRYIPNFNRDFRQRFGKTPSEVIEGSRQKAVGTRQKAVGSVHSVQAALEGEEILARAA